MTETTHDSAPPPPPGGTPGPGRGWNTEHLKDYRALRRSRYDRKVAGVAGGLGRHLNMDPTILRVLFVVLVFFGGAGLLLYGALWLLVPEEQTGATVVGTSDSTRNALLIAALVVAGLVAVSDTWNGYGFPWPLAVAAIVFFAVMLTRDRNARPGPGFGQPPAGQQTGAQGPWGSPTGATQAGPAASTGPATGPATGPTEPSPYAAAAAQAQPTPAAGTGYPPPPGQDGPGGTAWYPTPPPPPVRTDPRRTGPVLFGFTLALVALVLGALGLYEASGGQVADAAYPALALTVIGGMLLLGAFFGRAGGLILLGLVAAVVLGGAAVANPSFDGDRDLVARPTTAAAVQDSYRVPAGRIELDLTQVRDVAALDGRDIALDANVGEIVVVVPEDVAVHYDANVEAGGAIDVPGASRDGWGSSLEGELTSTGTPEATVDLNLDLDFGHIELRQG